MMFLFILLFAPLGVDGGCRCVTGEHTHPILLCMKKKRCNFVFVSTTRVCDVWCTFSRRSTKFSLFISRMFGVLTFRYVRSVISDFSRRYTKNGVPPPLDPPAARVCLPALVELRTSFFFFPGYYNRSPLSRQRSFGNFLLGICGPCTTACLFTLLRYSFLIYTPYFGT